VTEDVEEKYEDTPAIVLEPVAPAEPWASEEPAPEPGQIDIIAVPSDPFDPESEVTYIVVPATEAPEVFDESFTIEYETPVAQEACIPVKASDVQSEVIQII
jgi:hypothetical protein